MAIGLGLLAVAAALLVAGAELFVRYAAAAARGLGLSLVAVGVLLAGAEPEELVTAVVASVRDRPDLAAGDAIGANLTILTLPLGLAALVRPLPVAGRVRVYALASSGVGLLALLVLVGGYVSRFEGALLVGAYVVAVGSLWRREREPPVIGELAEDEGTGSTSAGPSAARSNLPGLARCLAGLAVMVVGGNVAVVGAVRVVDAVGATDTAVGLTLLALATSAEMFALVGAAARRGVTELAVAGIVGSVLYNATATLGVAALVRPLPVTGMFWPAAAAAALPLVVVGLAVRGRLGRGAGALLCLAYAVFAVWVAGR